MQTYVCLSFLKTCYMFVQLLEISTCSSSGKSRSILGPWVGISEWSVIERHTWIPQWSSIIGWHRIFPAKFWWLHLNPSMDLHHFSRRAAILLVTQTGISFGSMASGVVRRWLTDPKCRQTIANLLPINIPHIFHPHKYHTCQYCTLFHPPLCLPSAWRSTLLSAYNLIRIFRLLDSKQ